MVEEEGLAKPQRPIAVCLCRPTGERRRQREDDERALLSLSIGMNFGV